MSEPTTTSSFAHPTSDTTFATDQADEKVNDPDTSTDWDTKEDVDYTTLKKDDSVNQYPDSQNVAGGSAFAHDMLMASGIPNGKEDEGNHENMDRVKPLKINEDGFLVDSEGNKVFTTVEESIKDGTMELDAKGRQPGVYLDDLEDLQRRQYAKALETAHDAAAAGFNSPVERQVNVRNSGIPPVTVMSKQEHPDSGEAQNEDAKVPELKENPIPAE